MSDIMIVSAARTPVGTFNGAFANTPAYELGKVGPLPGSLRHPLRRA